MSFSCALVSRFRRSTTHGRGRDGSAASWPSPACLRPSPSFEKRRSFERARGFTLLEMLVALTIFSLAGLALVRLQAVSARTSVDLRQRTMAEIVARNLMIERMTDPRPPAEGTSTGTVENAGRQWRWSQQVDADENEARLIVVSIRVDGGPGQSPAVLTFGRTQ